MVRINLNEHVKFKPTDEGTDAVRSVDPHIVLEAWDPCHDEYELLLWEFCLLFGPHFHNGSNLIKDNTLVIGDANEHV